jgi:excisionase family DNA binding protein
VQQSQPRRERLYTTGDVARLFHVSRPAVKKWIKAGKLRAVRTPGGHFRIPARQLEGFRRTRDEREPPRILLVDDSEDVLATLADGFRHFWPDAKIECASDGYEALIKLGAFQPHVAVVDIRMPGLDGFEVCRRIKSNQVTSATKLLAITAHADLDTPRRARAAGADDFLAKPMGIHTLTTRVRALLDPDESTRLTASGGGGEA